MCGRLDESKCLFVFGQRVDIFLLHAKNHKLPACAEATPSVLEESPEIAMDQVEPVGGETGGGAINVNRPLPVPTPAAQQNGEHLVLAVFNNTMEVPKSPLSEDNGKVTESQLATNRVIGDIQVPIIPWSPTIPVSS